jgi:hypothetical protein
MKAGRVWKAWRRSLGGLPVLADYWDARAVPKDGGVSVWRWLGAAAGTLLAAAGTVTELLNVFLSEAQIAAVMLRAAVSWICTGVCVWLLVARETHAVLAAENGEVVQYTSVRSLRRGAKVGLPIFFAIAVSRTFLLLPNGVLGRPELSGFLCRSDGMGLGLARIEVLDVAGQNVGTRTEVVDSDGYFKFDLKRWAFAPTTIRLIDGCVGTATIDVSKFTVKAGRCAGEVADANRANSLPRWELYCSGAEH